MLNVIGNLIGANKGARDVSFFLGSPGSSSGSHNHIDWSGNDIVLTGEFTVSFNGFLVDQNSNPQSWSGICGNQSSYSDGRFSFYTNVLRIDSASSNSTISTSALNLEDTSQEITITRNSSNLITLYLDGVASGTATVAGNITVNRVMGNPDNSSYFGYCGGMRQHRIWSKELSEAERTTILNGGHVSDSCELWYKMNEKSGTTVTDYSGNGRHGTLANAGVNFFQTVKSTTNLLTNGGFTVWTGTPDNEIPDGFGRGGTYSTGVRYLEDSSGKCRIFTSDGGLMGVNKTLLQPYVNYKVMVYIPTVTSGGLYIYGGASGDNASSSFTTTGWHIFNFTGVAGGTTTLGLYRSYTGGANDVIASNIQLMTR
ncbi:MAG: hypothetical protein H6743_03725 [Rickettsiaceae bacterium]|nr:hypothetical protein [Rickettsiaceae bacterium]